MKKKLAYVVSTPSTYSAFLEGHAKSLACEYDITLIANFEGWDSSTVSGSVKPVHIPIYRKVSLWKDCIALVILFRHFRSVKYDIVHSFTPKAGLLGGIAAWAARVSIRIHSFTGQVWVTRRGASRFFLKMLDKLTFSLATDALADSPSQVKFLLVQGFGGPFTVLGDGAVCGIDQERFSPDHLKRAAIRLKYDIDTEDVVFIFLGRLNHDKGIVDLIHAFERAQLGPNCKLMVVGPDEENIVKAFRRHPLTIAKRIVFTGATSDPGAMMAAGDVICLPSYREGFGTSVLEGAATGLPSIVSRIYGLTDAVVEGETGLMHEVGNVEEIAHCLQLLSNNDDLRIRMGRFAYDRALAKFSSKRLTAELRKFYLEVAKRC
ncbi:glycosyltransferase family 4 protein [Sulfitobacter pontiacus]|uniref:glycosyltransferase family 4 protein n=1 Tax=Sulfitobacter pontiacus TaxID=60137 RepID=UPI0021A7C4CA|nr:glycosyltransferase family 4 protein [Sulfitobacter pontiacus]UWR20817.1 glycosyltransferase family 4 protein [Sulfitobacter pontiacus]